MERAESMEISPFRRSAEAALFSATSLQPIPSSARLKTGSASSCCPKGVPVNRLAAFALVLLVTGAAHAAEKKLDRTFAASPGGLLTVDADSATVHVTAIDSNQVVVHMISEGPEKELADARLEAVQAGEGVNVTLRRHQKSGWFNWNSWSGEDHIEVKVPRNYRVSVRTGGGDVELTDTTGTAKLNTSGGNIAAKNITGDIELRTSGGDILADQIRGAVDADTSGGDVRLLRVDGSIKGNTSGGSVRCSLVGVNREVSATTSGGDIELLLPRATKGTLEATTSGGEVDADLPITASVIKDGRLEGSINGGGARIYAHTSGGSISIRPAD
jgi:putative adhesin